MTWEVRASVDFWATVRPFKDKYPEREYLEIIRTIREAIAELREKGCIEETGWSEHALEHQPFADGSHFEFRIHGDDVLVVYFKRERRRVIRMVGVYDHAEHPERLSTSVERRRAAVARPAPDCIPLG